MPPAAEQERGVPVLHRDVETMDVEPPIDQYARAAAAHARGVLSAREQPPVPATEEQRTEPSVPRLAALPAVGAAEPKGSGSGGTNHWLQQLNYMKKLQPFYGNKQPDKGQQQRSWEEWKGEFLGNARLCHLEASKYYIMAEALLSQHMREVWLAYLRVKPEDNTWAGMDAYMGVHYSTMDKAQASPQAVRECKAAERK